MSSETSTQKKPWMGWLALLLFALLIILGFKFYSSMQSLKALEGELAATKSELASRDKQIAAVEALSKLPEGLCVPSPQDAADPMAPCAKCVSVLAKISPSSAQHAIELGRELVANYEKNADKTDYKDFKAALVKTSERLAAGDKVLFASEQTPILQQKDAQINALNHDKAQLQESLKADATLQAELQKCLSSSNFLIKKTTLDQPPCWVSDDGNLQYLFDLTLLPDDKVIVRPAWPAEREADAQALAPVRALTPYMNQEISMPFFMKHAYSILDIGKNQQPEACRFFVRMKSEIQDRESADKARLSVENVFYKFERAK